MNEIKHLLTVLPPHMRHGYPPHTDCDNLPDITVLIARHFSDCDHMNACRRDGFIVSNNQVAVMVLVNWTQGYVSEAVGLL